MQGVIARFCLDAKRAESGKPVPGVTSDSAVALEKSDQVYPCPRLDAS